MLHGTHSGHLCLVASIERPTQDGMNRYVPSIHFPCTEESLQWKRSNVDMYVYLIRLCFYWFSGDRHEFGRMCQDSLFARLCLWSGRVSGLGHPTKFRTYFRNRSLEFQIKRNNDTRRDQEKSRVLAQRRRARNMYFQFVDHETVDGTQVPCCDRHAQWD